MKNKILEKVAKSLFIFVTTPNEVEKYPKMMQSNSSDNCIHCYNIQILNLFDPELQWLTLNEWLKTVLKNCSVSWNSLNIGQY